MTLAEWTAPRGMRLALGAFVLGLAACGWVYRRAKTVEPLPRAMPSNGIVAGALTTPGKPADVNVMAAVSADLFAADRKAPAKRYRLPGEAEPPAPVVPAVPVVLGTGYNKDDKWFATVTIDFGRPLIRYVGDPVGQLYTVKSIERGKVTFVTNGTGKTFDILVPNTGS